MPCIVGRIESGSRRGALDDQCYRLGGKPRLTHILVPVDRAKERSASKLRYLNPRLHRSYRTRRLYPTIRNACLASGSLLVGLASPYVHHHTLVRESKVPDFQAYELAPAKRTREAKEKQGPIASACQAGVQRSHHRPDVVRERRLLALLRRTVVTAYAGHHLSDSGIGGGCGESSHLVRLRNR